MSRCSHQMPFGAEVLDDGAVRFRLWAPGATTIELVLLGTDGSGRDSEKILPMEPESDGWRQCITADACAGSRYRYRVDGELQVPDPASRFQPLDVHGPSEVIDPRRFAWTSDDWRGRPWEETVIYELHPGTFSARGDYAGIRERLPYLAELGVTAVELMPVSDFPGRRNWGYDGVLPFAPDATYGRPDALKRLVEAAHAHGLMIFLDVVYNHFGPEGNYLHRYAPQFFTERHQTPWGAGINFDGDGSRQVRDFFIHNALYWLEEYRFDGLRFDAVHAIADDSQPHVLEELAAAVHEGPGRSRQVHLVLENDDNATRYLEYPAVAKPRRYRAQWNDDYHHAAHVLATGETDGYYLDYASDAVGALARCLTQGFAYQGDASAFRDGIARGEPSAHLAPTAFVSFLQNHDQIGNRALGERIGQLAPPEALRALTAITLLAPSPPLLFMGQEVMTDSPFLFFCDFGGDLAEAVTAGRRREFGRFERFATPDGRAAIPDPNDSASFERSRLDWADLSTIAGRRWYAFHHHLLQLRQRELVPHLAKIRGASAHAERLGANGILVEWPLADSGRLTLLANLSSGSLPLAELQTPLPAASPLYLEPTAAADGLSKGELAGWTVAWYLVAPDARP